MKTITKPSLRYSPANLRFLHALACAAALPLTAHVASAQTWQGATSGSLNTSNLNTWNLSTNWNPTTIPNAAGSTATFNTLTGELTVFADTAAATNITIGTLNLNSNQNLSLGSTGVSPTDLGTFTFDGNSSAAVLNVGSAVSSGIGIILRSKASGGFALTTDLTVNLNAGANTGRTFNVNSSFTPVALGSAALNGNGRTITLNGGRLAFLGNGSSLRNVTVNLRNADKLALDIGSSSNHLETNVTYQIGKAGGQEVAINGTLNVAAKWELSGDVEFFGGSTRGFTNSGFIEDASGSNTVTYGNAALTSGFGSVTLSGANANTYSGGTLVRLTANTTLLNANKAGAFGTGLLTLNTGNVKLGANQTIGGLAGLTGSSVTGNSTSIQRELEINSANNASYAGALGNGGTGENNLRLVKNGIGIQTLSGNSTYTGTTTVTAGTLLVNGSLGASSAVSVSNVGTLGGSGSVLGTVTTAGTGSVIAPGNSPGNLTLGALNASSGSTFNFELGTTSDLLTINGLFTGSTAANGLVFNFSDSGGLVAGSAYTLMSFASVSSLDYADFFANTLPVSFILDTTFGTGGYQINTNNLQVQFAVIPEPTTSAMLGLGLLSLIGLRRMSNRKPKHG